MSGRKNDIPKLEEISGILAAVSKELPGLVKGILDSFFSSEAAADMVNPLQHSTKLSKKVEYKKIRHC